MLHRPLYEAEGASAYFKARAGFSGDREATVREMYGTFVKDITEGIGDTGVRAGVIKVGTSRNVIAPYEEMVLEAAAMAQKETGVPIITHTEGGTMAPEQAQFLISKGADPKRLMVGHICGNANLQYHLAVLEQGAFISFDRIGLDFIFPDKLRLATIIGLAGIGYTDQIMLSHDCIIRWLGRPFVLMKAAEPLVANWVMTHIFENILPALKKGGLTDQQITPSWWITPEGCLLKNNKNRPVSHLE